MRGGKDAGWTPDGSAGATLRVRLQAVGESTDVPACSEAEHTAPGVRLNDDRVFPARATGP